MRKILLASALATAGVLATALPVEAARNPLTRAGTALACQSLSGAVSGTKCLHPNPSREQSCNIVLGLGGYGPVQSNAWACTYAILGRVYA